MQSVNLAEKLALITACWSPRVVGAVNDCHVKLVKLRGEFVWHAHELEDELFLVLEGTLRMQFRAHEVAIRKGEFLVVPRGTEHRPVADEEVHVLLLEPATTVNTGTAGGERTREADRRAVMTAPGTASFVVLRPWRPSDREVLAALANDRRISINLRDGFPYPYGVADADRFIAMARSMEPQTYFAIEMSGQLAGGVGYTRHTDVERVAAEVGYWIGAPFWGRGIATEAVRLITATAFSLHPELRRLYALPFASNAASARVLEKAGYQREAVMRQSAIKEGIVQDQWLYAILRDEAVHPDGR